MPNAPLDDLTGRVFGKWTVTGYAGRGNGASRSSRWSVVCECGRIGEASRGNLVQGLTTSCGHHRTLPGVLTKHGRRHTTEYYIWSSMKQRCRNPMDAAYHHYGGRGIRVCRGLEEFTDFLRIVGLRPAGLSLDRKENDLHYSCGDCSDCLDNGWSLNVRWATGTQQGRNRRNNRMLTTSSGETLTMAAWSERLGISIQAISGRLRRGWSVDRAVSAPRTIYGDAAAS